MFPPAWRPGSGAALGSAGRGEGEGEAGGRTPVSEPVRGPAMEACPGVEHVVEAIKSLYHDPDPKR